MDFTLHLFLRIFLWALFILILWGLVGSQKILYPPKQDLDLGPKDEGIDYEAFHTLTGDGIKIHGWYYPGRDAKGVVIVCHGF
jgi:uncharacterized protein